jgi:23S rRNA (adenine-N6)-dimethyltransferase
MSARSRPRPASTSARTPARSRPRRTGTRASHRPGPHELGRNLLTDQAVAADVVGLVAGRGLPIVEWAAGTGALTRRLARLGPPVEAVELDPAALARLRRAVGPHVAITEGDILRHAPPPGPYDVVANLPFHLTTPAIRRLLGLPGWQRAVLVTQWEVARKRAGVGGTTLLTAQWWPWYVFALRRRVPAAAFSPRPSVDAGVLVVDRRERPLVDGRAGYQRWVRAVFTGPGHGVPAILARAGLPRPVVARWARAEGVGDRALPRDLNDRQWASAYALHRRYGAT